MSGQGNLIAGLWIAWLIVWGVSAIGVKRAVRRESRASRLSHMLPLAVVGWLLAAPHAGGSWLAMRFLPPAAAWFWLGLALLAAGLGFSVAARVSLGGNWSGTVTLKDGHELIRRGPYRIVRHPIYTGLLMGLLGTALAIGELRGLVALGLATVAFLRKIPIEERFLTDQFGEAYGRYRAEVPALVPLLR
jgi:protein-S-isoprenylcysteine O-methyltransferase Ste14